MSIDPRMTKQIIQLQLAPSLDFQANSNPLTMKSGNGQASLFDTVLSQYMKDVSTDPNNSTGSTAEALALLSNLPSTFDTAALNTAATTGSTDYEMLIAQASAKYGVDPKLIRGVIQTESGFNADAVSSAGAKGLMQLMDATARGLGVTDSLNPQQNIDGGTKYLSYLLNKYNGNQQVALAAYNAGPGRIDRLGISTDNELQAKMALLPQETQRYVTKVQQASY
ncbi:MAG: lytic transglycosylase domain-containing protein [Candidatus Pristimantibacillus sp.]